MNGLNKVVIPITTASDGSATAYSAGVYGLLYAVSFLKGTLADTADVAVSIDGGAFDNAVMTITNLTTSNDGPYYPRANSCDASGTVGTSADCLHIIDGKIKVVVAQGGDTLSGSVVVTWIDEA